MGREGSGLPLPPPPMGVGIPLLTPKLGGTHEFPLPLPHFFKVSKHWSEKNPHSTLPLQKINTTLIAFKNVVELVITRNL